MRPYLDQSCGDFMWTLMFCCLVFKAHAILAVVAPVVPRVQWVHISLAKEVLIARPVALDTLLLPLDLHLLPTVSALNLLHMTMFNILSVEARTVLYFCSANDAQCI